MSHPLVIDTSVNDPSLDLAMGVRTVHGDGTVPLLSLGYMCAKGWRSKRWNPHDIKVLIREFPHIKQSLLEDARYGIQETMRGPTSSDHVDIMGNHEMIKDLVLIASNQKSRVPERIVSEIREISENVNL